MMRKWFMRILLLSGVLMLVVYMTIRTNTTYSFSVDFPTELIRNWTRHLTWSSDIWNSSIHHEPNQSIGQVSDGAVAVVVTRSDSNHFTSVTMAEASDITSLMVALATTSPKTSSTTIKQADITSSQSITTFNKTQSSTSSNKTQTCTGTAITTTPYPGLSPKLLCHSFTGRLGNLLFQYASVLGLAIKLNRTAVFRQGGELDNVLKRSTRHPTNQSEFEARCSQSKSMNEGSCCKFNLQFMKMDPRFDYNIGTYLQSWVYFEGCDDQIREAVTFKDAVQKEALAVVNKLRSEKPSRVLVGVHVRRGDFTTQGAINLGYVTASPQFFNTSFAYFQHRFTNVTFVTASEDMKWCKSHFPAGHDVVYLDSHAPAVDMFILSQMDHIITSFGTYSWWCAYLNKGTVIYFKNFIVPNTMIGNQFNPGGSDYVLPKWIGL